MISSYRLGDLVLLGLNTGEICQLVKDYPTSIGADYAKHNYKINDMNKIINIVLQRTKLYNHLLPDDISESTVIHLRLGNVMCGTTDHEKNKRPLSLEYLKKHVQPDKKTYIIGKPFFAKDSSNNYDDCIGMSEKYLNDVISYFNATHFIGENADIDLCCAIKCKYFIQGMGFFSDLIAKIREKLNLQVKTITPEKIHLFPPALYSTKNNKNTVLFIEPRSINHSINILKQTYNHLKDDWNYVFYCGKSYFDFLKQQLPNFVELRRLECDNLLPNQYNDLLKKKELWDSLYGEFVLTIQLDCWIANVPPYTIDFFLKLNKSYIGGNMSYKWSEMLQYNLTPKIQNFNGGLSLRKKEDMIKIINAFPPKKTLLATTNKKEVSYFERYPEDVYFTIGCYKLGLPIGDDEASSHFALHTIYYNNFFGIHNAHNDLRDILSYKYPNLIKQNPYIYFNDHVTNQKNIPQNIQQNDIFYKVKKISNLQIVNAVNNKTSNNNNTSNNIQNIIPNQQIKKGINIQHMINSKKYNTSLNKTM